jgi:hypothetical protein
MKSINFWSMAVAGRGIYIDRSRIPIQHIALTRKLNFTVAVKGTRLDG